MQLFNFGSFASALPDGPISVSCFDSQALVFSRLTLGGVALVANPEPFFDSA